VITECVNPTSALENALRDFNVAFDMDLRLPIWPRDLESAALIAELRGRQDIAGKLRVFLPASVTLDPTKKEEVAA
jgi:hypothetical protein